mmetsp:Transcript_135592/g.351459  ORF Transcript_135592/g.351459 Transcript_135592/m.351459 type:complete len:81 (-) Transcript_135592:52-294(-)
MTGQFRCPTFTPGRLASSETAYQVAPISQQAILQRKDNMMPHKLGRLGIEPTRPAVPPRHLSTVPRDAVISVDYRAHLYT